MNTFYPFSRPRLSNGSASLSLLALALSILSACSSVTPDEHAVGHLVMNLTGQTGEHLYRLQDATFELTGATDVQFNGNDHPRLEQELPVGDYQLKLLGNWTLLQETPEGTTSVEARLITENPLLFSVFPGEITRLVLQFQTVVEPITLGTGILSVELSVDERNAEELVITELMPNPKTLPDADGEWFEIANTGAQSVNLRGCRVVRGNGSFEVTEDASIASGSIFTFASSEAPGFKPDYTYEGIVLPNSGKLELSISCRGVEMDRAVIEAAVPRRNGASLSLSRGAFSPDGNDLASSWCLGHTDYGGELGSPGLANPPCET